MEINKNIIKEFKKRGFNVYSSDSRKKVLQFEAEPISNDIFSIFKRKPFVRVLYQLIQDEIPLTIDEVLLELNEENLKKVFTKAPLINLYCPHCGNIIDYYNPYMNKKPRRKAKCSECHIELKLNECKEGEDWRLSHNEVNHLVNIMVDVKLFKKLYFGFCPIHGANDIEVVDYDDINSLGIDDAIKYIKNMYCNKCKNLFEIDLAFPKNENLSDMFDTGFWLEGYIKHLLKSNKTIEIENGIVVVDSDGINFEVDLVIYHDGKLTCIECKAKDPKTTLGRSEVPFITEWKDFSDKVILVSTCKMKTRDKQSLVKSDVDVLEILEIENIKNHI